MTLEDELYDRILDLSRRKRIPIKTAIHLALSAGLQELSRTENTADFKQQTYNLGKPYSEYDLIKALESAGELEASEIKRKLDLRK